MELPELVKRLIKAKDQNDGVTVIEILEALETQTITVELLKTTKVGHIINKLRKFKHPKVQSMARELLQKWKNAVRRPSKGAEAKKEVIATKPKNPAPKPPKKRTAEGIEVWDIESQLTMQKIRNVVRKKLSLALEHEPATCNYVKIAVDIENKLWFEHGQDKKRYSQQYRDICFNLRDKKNTDFKNRVLSLEIEPREIVYLCPEDMASKSQTKARDDAKKWTLAAQNLDLQMAAAQKLTEDYRCGKCGNKKCSYFQMQTRGADEPMTTFVTCIKCNNKWKD